MENVFKQSDYIDKIIFDTYYKHVEKFEEILPDDIAGYSFHEIESKTIDSQPEDIWRIEIYVGDDFSSDNIMELINGFIRNADLKGVSALKMERVEEKDWIREYQKQQRPLIVDSFYVCNNKQLPDCPENLIPICIESSKAFGTGEHETTSGCIRMLSTCADRYVNNVLDIGTGTGILSFAAEKIWPKAAIYGSDIDPVSVQVAKINGQYNNSKAVFYENTAPSIIDLPDNFKYLEEPKFDIIVSNILLQPLISLSRAIKSLSSSETRIILSGFLDYQAPEIITVYQSQGFDILESVSRNKWQTILLKVKRG